MATYKAVVVNPGYESYDLERGILTPLDVEIIVAENDCTTEDDVIAVAEEADAILLREAPITRRVLNTLASCKIVSRYGVGVDNVDLDYARQKGIYVSNVPGYGTEEVSDHAVALLLACIRRLTVRDRSLRQGIFETDINDRIYRTTGKVLGLVGYGLIGQAVHRKWKGFLPERTLVHDPFTSAEVIRDNGAEQVYLETLLTHSDFISVHAPLTEETRHLIDAAAFNSMKHTAILINTARGEVVDEKAMIKALGENTILGAGIDVFEQEPLEENHPFLKMDNIVLSGHVGWYSKDALEELQTRAAREIYRVLSGQKPQCWVNPW